jgi:hypothetical protein
LPQINEVELLASKLVILLMNLIFL